ncbi:pentapeptide repeat-containing protein [Shimia sp. MIT1388]|uniref:pentapeptide repeat-containing protein n=1 Tax=Shimia sp. MIT1388 TaxID=3096992 RepID=UPI00399988EB
MVETDFEMAKLHCTNLSSTDLVGTFLEDASLSRANLIGAKLNGCHLSGSQLMGASLFAADLSRSSVFLVDFTGARLNETLFLGSDLRSVDFSQAKLEGSNFDGAILDSVTFDTLTGLKKVSFKGTALKHTDFRSLDEGDLPWDNTFGDVNVELPKGVKRPSHWPDQQISYDEFQERRRDWIASQIRQ